MLSRLWGNRSLKKNPSQYLVLSPTVHSATSLPDAGQQGPLKVPLNEILTPHSLRRSTLKGSQLHVQLPLLGIPFCFGERNPIPFPERTSAESLQFWSMFNFLAGSVRAMSCSLGLRV